MTLAGMKNRRSVAFQRWPLTCLWKSYQADSKEGSVGRHTTMNTTFTKSIRREDGSCAEVGSELQRYKGDADGG